MYSFNKFKLGLNNKSLAKTGNEVEEIFKKCPHTKDFKLAYCYIRQSPNCYLAGNEVFTLHDIEPCTELTLNYLN